MDLILSKNKSVLGEVANLDPIVWLGVKLKELLVIACLP
jgi:hypothetical protein